MRARHEAAIQMFEAGSLPTVLQAPTLALTDSLAEQQLVAAPEGVEVERWLLALVTVWRLKIAATLAANERCHDENSLQALLDEAAQTRDWLASLEVDPAPGLREKAAGLRDLLSKAWGEALESAPTPGRDEAARAQPRAGQPALFSAQGAKKVKAPSAPVKRAALLPKRPRWGLRLALFGLLLGGLGLAAFDHTRTWRSSPTPGRTP